MLRRALASWHLWSLLLVAVTGFFLALPTFLSPQTRRHLPNFMPSTPVTLGLDLRGGVHLVLEVDTQQTVRETYTALKTGLIKALRQDKIFHRDVSVNDQGIQLTLVDPQQIEALKARVNALTGTPLEVRPGSGGRVKIAMFQGVLESLRSDTLASCVKIIRKRIDQSGTLEPTLQTQGDRRIILQIPGFQDPAKVRALLGSTAKMSFHWVVDGKHAVAQPLSIPLASNKSGDDHNDGPTLPLDPESLMSGDDVLEARAAFSQDELGKSIPSVGLTMTGKGAKAFSEVTGPDNQGRRLAIVLDGKVLTAPSINAHITTGQASISPIESLEKAQELATLISSGALPAPLSVLEEKVVGPQLGQDSIVQGTWATGLAVLAVAAWMLMVYGTFGVFSIIGIIFNLLFLFAGMVLLGATLTLPGLAGIALTVGMAVDANVLINERIREEIALGQNVLTALENGYQRARASIVDSNVTTLVGSGLLYMAGTGPVRGFAVTMALGILISMVTAMGLTHQLVRSWAWVWAPRRLSM